MAKKKTSASHRVTKSANKCESCELMHSKGAIIVIVIALALILYFLVSKSGAGAAGITGTTDFSQGVHPRLNFLKIETDIAGPVRDVLVSYTYNGRDFTDARMKEIGNGHYVAAIPNRSNAKVSYLIKAINSDGSISTDPDSGLYASNAPQRALRRRSVAYNKNYTGFTGRTLHGANSADVVIEPDAVAYGKAQFVAYLFQNDIGDVMKAMTLTGKKDLGRALAEISRVYLELQK